MNCSGGQTDGTPAVRRTTEQRALAMTVVHAVANAEAESATSLPPLGSVIDLEALEALVADASDVGHVTFSYAGRRVVVTDEAVEVY